MIDKIADLLLSARPSRYLIQSARNLFFPQRFSEANGKTIGIEATSSCNARCVFCAYKLGLRSPHTLSLEKFQQLTQQAISLGYRYLDLTPVTGEFFLHPQALDFITSAKKAGFVHIGTYTNAILLHRFDLTALLQSGINALLISFPGFEAGEYRAIFGVDKYEEFEGSVTRLLESHQRLGSGVFIIFEPRSRRSYDEIVKSPYFQAHRDLFNEKVIIGKPIRVFDSWAGAIQSLPGGLTLGGPTLKSLAPLKRVHPCVRLFLPGVWADGRVRLCNCRYNEDTGTEQDGLAIGNLADYSGNLATLFRENEKKIQTIRQNFSLGNLPALCQKCTFYSSVRTPREKQYVI